MISILMPIKNAAPYLTGCLKSIISQTDKEWELLAVNDHSEDETEQILAKFAKKDSRIKVLHNEGKGIINALRTAYSQSKYPLITRMDADDKMVPQKLAVLKNLLTNAGPGHLATGKVRYFAAETVGNGFLSYQNWLNQLMEKGTHYSEIYRECVIPSPCWMIFREDLEKCDAFRPDTYPEDYDLCFRFYKNQLKIVASQDVLHLWRDYPTRTSRTDPNYADNRFLNLKLRYFLELDRDKERPLVIWGAGKKGKWVASRLNSRNLSFHWLCNNPNKIGREIYRTVLESTEDLEQIKQPQILVAVAGPDDLKEIEGKMDALGYVMGKDCYFLA